MTLPPSLALPDPTPTRVLTTHRRAHVRGGPVAGCWLCQRDYAVCLSKRTYTVREDADSHADEINARVAPSEFVTRYPCDFGSAEEPHWHVRHCRPGRELRRARRRWWRLRQQGRDCP